MWGGFKIRVARAAVSSTPAKRSLVKAIDAVCDRDIWQHIANGRRRLIIGEDLKDVFKRIMDKYKDFIFFLFFFAFFFVFRLQDNQLDVCMICEKSVWNDLFRSVDAIVR